MLARFNETQHEPPTAGCNGHEARVVSTLLHREQARHEIEQELRRLKTLAEDANGES
jgi:hypothetical protein